MKRALPFVSTVLSKTLLASMLVVTPAITSVVFTSAGIESSFGQVEAQVKPRNKQFEKRKLEGMGESVAKKVQEAYDLLQPPEEKKLKPQPDRALQVLNGIPRDKLNSNELGNVYKFSAYAYLAKEDYPKALEQFRKLLALSPAIDVATEKQTTLTLAQLYQATENYPKALEMLNKWLDYVDVIKPEQYQQFASLYYQIDDKKNALLNVNEAVRLQEAAGKVPAESWYGLQRGLYLEKEDYKNAVIVVQKLAVAYPKPSHWKTLSQLYSVQEKPKEATSALEACYLLGGLTTEKDLLNLSYMLVDAEAPYKAAKVVNKGIYTDKIIEPTAKNLKFLADVYRAAREDKKSLAEYEKAAQKSTDGDLILGLAEMYMANDNYKEASRWAKDAVAKGTKRTDRANMTIGQAELELKNYDTALTYFKRAAGDERSARVASQWITHTERQQRLASQSK